MPQELTTNREAEMLDECQSALSYQFRNLKLLRLRPLTHASRHADTRLSSNLSGSNSWAIPSWVWSFAKCSSNASPIPTKAISRS